MYLRDLTRESAGKNQKVSARTGQKRAYLRLQTGDFDMVLSKFGCFSEKRAGKRLGGIGDETRNFMVVLAEENSRSMLGEGKFICWFGGSVGDS